MLTESSLKKKYFFLLVSSILTLTNPVEGKNSGHFNFQNPSHKNLNKNKSTDRFIIGVSYFNALRKEGNAFEGRFEYRSSFTWLSLKPFTGITFTSSGAFYRMTGFYSDISLGNNIIFTPSFAAGYFDKGMGHDLAYNLEFRTQLEISYTLQNNSRIGISFDHISNGNLGKSNPGAESFSFIYSLPIN
jgi:lipid A 3-O-deacylase